MFNVYVTCLDVYRKKILLRSALFGVCFTVTALTAELQKSTTTCLTWMNRNLQHLTVSPGAMQVTFQPASSTHKYVMVTIRAGDGVDSDGPVSSRPIWTRVRWVAIGEVRWDCRGQEDRRTGGREAGRAGGREDRDTCRGPGWAKGIRSADSDSASHCPAPRRRRRGLNCINALTLGRGGRPSGCLSGGAAWAHTLWTCTHTTTHTYTHNHMHTHAGKHAPAHE